MNPPIWWIKIKLSQIIATYHWFFFWEWYFMRFHVMIELDCVFNSTQIEKNDQDILIFKNLASENWALRILKNHLFLWDRIFILKKRKSFPIDMKHHKILSWSKTSHDQILECMKEMNVSKKYNLFTWKTIEAMKRNVNNLLVDTKDYTIDIIFDQIMTENDCKSL